MLLMVGCKLAADADNALLGRVVCNMSCVASRLSQLLAMEFAWKLRQQLS